MEIRRKKNDLKQFAEDLASNKYLQTRRIPQKDYLGAAHWFRDLADDIEDGVVGSINILHDAPDIDQGKFYEPPPGKHGHITHSVNGKKRIVLISYEYNEK